MTKNEYNAERVRIKEEAEQKRRSLDRRYAYENNPYELGDIIEDHIGKGRILGMRVYENYVGFPFLVYTCENLTKRGTVNKREPERKIYQINLKQ